jgi:DNA-directed RNA polymerase subunit RPC12/RpoP
MSDQAAAPVASHSYPCAGCGARVEYAPGTEVLRCPYCGYEQQVAAPSRAVREHAFAELATLPRKPVASLGAQVFGCPKCGAQTASNTLSDRCQFCGSPVVAAPAVDQIAPEAVLPFGIDRDAVRTALRTWVNSRWFAPSRLKKVTEAESLKGTYLPHWTFDARTTSDYTGQRGEHYYTTESYTVQVDGRTETRTRQVQHTRWYPASGTVQRDFDDVLVPATGYLPNDKLDKLDPWPLEAAVAYQPDYLSGHQTLRYDTEPEAGLETAKGRMAKVIENDCRADIGGDEQRVNSVDTNYFDLTYKLMLLPVWILGYLYGGRTFQVMVNGRTGEVIGQRPYSAGKIALAITAAVVVLTVIILLLVYAKG